MTTTVGRVEFLVGLDGKNMPAQARRIANQIAAAGTKSGKDFGSNFESSFERSLTNLGKMAEQKLSAAGKLAGRRFSEDFDDAVSGRFRRMQSNLAELLSDKDSFLDFARGFDTVGDATKQLQADLDDLVGKQIKYVNAAGKTVKVNVLASGEYQTLSKAIRDYGREADRVIIKERALARQHEDLEADFRRLTRTVGDVDVFREFADELGGTEEAFLHLKKQIEDTGTAMKHSRGDIEQWVDVLEKTRHAADRANDSMKEVERRPSALQRAFGKLGNLLAKPFTSLDNDVRLVIGLIASGADQVAVLGSAAGAGLIAIGGAASSAIIGVAGLATVFSKLNADLEDLPANLRPVAREFGVFKSSLSDLANVIAGNAFGRLEGVFDSLSVTVSALAPAFGKVGAAIGDLGRDFAIAVAPGTEAFGNLEALVEAAAVNFGSLGRSAGTLGGALVRAFDRAQPLVEDLLGWVDDLVTTFDDFTRSRGFAIWVSDAQRIFGSLGELLDSVGTALNNLATPDAVSRTADLLENLAGFVPVLGDVLAVLGELDPLGIVAEALNELGEAVAPLIDPLGRLAEALNVQLSAAISGLVGGLAPFVTALSPVIDGLALLIRVVPPPAISALAGALVALAASTVALNAANALGDLSAKLESSATGMGKLATPTFRAGQAFEKLSRFLGVGGVAVSGFLALTQGIKDLSREMVAIDDVSRNLVGTNTSLARSYKKLNSDIAGNGAALAPTIENWDAVLDVIDRVGPPLQNFGLAFTTTGQQALALAGTLAELDPALATLSLNDSTKQFSDWATEIGASDQQVLALIDKMPQFKEQLIAASKANGGLATDQELLTIALGRGESAADDSVGALARLAGQAGLTEDEVTSLSDAIKNFGNTQLNTREASRQFDQSLLDLNETLTKNGVQVDTGTQAAIDNSAAIDDVIKSVNEHAGAILEETGNQEAANAALADGRSKLEDMIRAFDPAGLAAGNYNDILDDIPTDIDTVITADTKQAELNLLRLQLSYDKIKDKTVQITINGRVNQFNEAAGSQRIFGASGMLLNRGAQMIVGGEAGPEALVPLRRPLSLVDPAVRALSAIAQGKAAPVFDGAPVAGGINRSLNISPGAIQIIGPDPRRAANEVVNRIVERAS